MIYKLDDHMPFKHVVLYGIQELFAILIATLLIASICDVSVGAGLIGAGVATLIYILFTRGHSNVYVSNSGAYVAPVLLAFGLGGATGAIIGALTVCVIYILFGLIFQQISLENMYKLLPKPLIGTITILIGLSLINYIPSYLGDSGIWGICIALLVVLVIALVMHYGSNRIQTLPFLIAVGVGYIVCLILTITNIYPCIDFSIFNNATLFAVPEFNFMNLNSIGSAAIITIIITYLAYSFSGICEVIADHQAMSVVIGEDLFEKNKISRIFLAMGCANAVSGFTSGLCQTTYGEGTGCAAASRVANYRVTAFTSILLILLGFCGYIQAFIVSIPSVIFAGASFVLYPLIAIAGFKMLINNRIDLDNSKNMIIVAVPLAIGLSGIAIGGTTFSLGGTALALVVGIILNLILREKKVDVEENI